MPCALAKGYPIIPTINSFNAKTRCQKEQLKFARKENVHIEFGQVAFVFACLEELFVRPHNMLQLLNSIVLSARIKKHTKLVVWRFDLVFQVDLRRSIEGITQVINVGHKSIDNK